VGVECGGLGGDPSVVSGGADADQGDRAGAWVLEEHGEEGDSRGAAAGLSATDARFSGGCSRARIRELLQACPTMPATVIAERIEWPYSIRTLSTRVAELRPIYVPPDPASRTSYLAGEIAQCDFWFPPIRLPVGFGQTRTATQLPVLTMITGYARWALALLLPTRRAEDLYTGWRRLLEQLGAVPRVLVWDGEAAVGRWRPRQPQLTTACQAFRGVLGVKVLICKPADPEAKGGIERLHDYLERSFLPGRSFGSPADFNNQLQAWLQLANTRQKRSLGCAPADRIAADKAAMLALPPVPPATGWEHTLRLPRDHYVRLDSNDYSVHPTAVGRRVLLRADLDRVRVWCQGDLVADHLRIWARHQTISDPAHVKAAQLLGHQRLTVVPPVTEPRWNDDISPTMTPHSTWLNSTRRCHGDRHQNGPGCER
jgi:transposase